MKICGIVAEYNPFHNGHALHIAATRALLGDNAAIVCVMSGNFTQRGEPAILEKHARAEAAVRCGADLVLELPLPWALSSAEGFAQGAVSLLAATGVVTHLSFGSESADLAAMEQAAALLLRPELNSLLREALGRGVSYGNALQSAAEKLSGGPLPVLRRPNDLLGVEYLKAIRRGNLPLVPVAVRREGAGHDAASPEAGQIKSGLFLRMRMGKDAEISNYIPPAAMTIFREKLSHGAGPVFPNALATPLLSRLRMLPKEAFAALPDAGEGIENRLYKAAREAPDLDALYNMAAAKRYPLARIRRMFWGAGLGLRWEDAAGVPPYLRILAANAAGCALLARMRTTAAQPVLTKPAAARDLDTQARRAFVLDAAATDFYALGFPSPAERRGGGELRTSPAIIMDQEKTE